MRIILVVLTFKTTQDVINAVKHLDTETMKPCAQCGLTNTIFGTNWQISQEFNDIPHDNGGKVISIVTEDSVIDLNIERGELLLTSNEGYFALIPCIRSKRYD